MVCDLTWSDRICYVNSPALSSYKYFSIDQVPLISSYIHKCRPIRSSAKLFYINGNIVINVGTFGAGVSNTSP